MARIERKQISKKTRFEVFKRDGFVCQYCGAHPPLVILEADHINPVVNGGTNCMDNLITACADCNRGKSGNLLTAIPKSLKDHAEDIQEMEAQLAGYRKIIQKSLDRIEADMWRVAHALEPETSEQGVYRERLRSIKMFNSKLPLHIVLEAAEIASTTKPIGKNRFLYFCGICWSRVRGVQDGTI